MCCDSDGYGPCSLASQVQDLESGLEQARDAIRALRVLAFGELHETVYSFGREQCVDECKRCAAEQYFDWNFNY